jgi:hypothetical protein
VRSIGLDSICQVVSLASSSRSESKTPHQVAAARPFVLATIADDLFRKDGFAAEEKGSDLLLREPLKSLEACRPGRASIQALGAYDYIGPANTRAGRQAVF